MRTLFVGLLMAVSCWSYADVDTSSGNYFHSQCKNSAHLRLACTMYVRGISDGLVLYGSRYAGVPTLEELDKTIGTCMPNGITYEQMGDVFFNYLEKHPESRHLQAAGLVLKSFQEAWPCK